MSATILDGRALCDEILDQVASRVAELVDSGWSPRLVSIKVGDNPAVELYIRNQRRKADQAGILFDEKSFSADTTVDELRAAIAALNVDPRVTGIILQRSSTSASTG